MAPQRPPDAILAAAATVTAAGLEAGLWADEGGSLGGDGPMQGPPPPAYVVEADAAPADARAAEVRRIHEAIKRCGSVIGLGPRVPYAHRL